MKTKMIIAASIIAAVVIAGCILLDSSDSDAARNQITVSCDHGYIIDSTTGQEYNGGDFTDKLSLRFVPNNGFEFVEWVVKGNAVYTEKLDSIEITQVNGEITLSAYVRNYSLSTTLFNTIDIDDLPVPGDSLTLNWSFSSSNLDTTKDPWVGSPSVPLIVGNCVYIHAGNYLYCLDSASGKILHSVYSPVVLNTFYYYISYGNGIIFDTIGHKAYDLELNYLFDIPSNLKSAYYCDGYFYGCLRVDNGYQLYRATADVNNGLVNNVKVNIFNNKTVYNTWAQYGQFSSFYIKNGWIFFLEAETRTGQRALTAVNIETEEHETVDLVPAVGNMYWDDGWLTEYDDYFYVTAYSAGLFGGVSNELKDKYSRIAWVKFDFGKGKFETLNWEEIKSPSGSKFQGIASQLVVYKGRGYVNVRSLGTDTLGGSNDAGTCLISFDIGPGGKPLERYACSSVMSHGGLVLNTAHEDEGKLYLYLIPYNPMSRIYVFTDVYDGTEWKLESSPYRFVTDDEHNQYCSQGIRAGPNGEMIFYQDSGWIDCYIPQSKFKGTVIVSDGESATVSSGYGKDIGDVFNRLYPQAKITDGGVSLGGETYQIYVLNEVGLAWNRLSNFDVSKYTDETSDRGKIFTHYRYLIFLKDGSSKNFYDQPGAEKGWYYLKDDGYKKCVLFDSDSLDDADGQYLVYLTEKSDVSNVIKRNVSVNRGSVVSLDIESKPGVDIRIRDKSVASVTEDGGVLKVEGLKESSTVLVITTDGKVYEISVSVQPKVTVNGDTTTIESFTEQVTEDGNILITNSTVEKIPGRQTENKTVVKKDKDGTVLETTTVHETIDDNGDTDENGNPVKVTERTIAVTDNNNEKIEDTVVREEKTVVSNSNGSATVTTVTSVIDRISKTNTITTKSEISYGPYSVIEKRIESFEGNNAEPSNSSYDYEVRDASEKSEIILDGNETKIVLRDKSSSSISFLLDMLAQPSKQIVVQSGSVIDGDAMTALSDAGAVLIISSNSSSMEIRSETIANLAGKGDVSLVIADSVGSLTPRQSSAAGDAKVFSIELTCGNDQQHDFGTFRLSLSCVIDIQDGKELKAWRIDDYGKKTYATNVEYHDGIVSFDADHLSIYAVGYESESTNGPDGGSDGKNGNVVLYAGIGAVAILALVGGVILLRRRG